MVQKLAQIHFNGSDPVTGLYEKLPLEVYATIMKEQSYSPYSKFRVGCALETADGSIFLGTNVENASYGLTVCAERTAAFAAVAAGHREFRRVAIATDVEVGSAPCGACRQVLYEFGGPGLEVIDIGTKHIKVNKLGVLLPLGFGPLDLAGYGHGV